MNVAWCVLRIACCVLRVSWCVVYWGYRGQYGDANKVAARVRVW